MKNIPKFTYETEDDVLNIWLSKKPIDFAEQGGNVIVHFTQENEPVYIEILDASEFLKQAVTKFPRKVLETVMPPSFSSITQKVK